MVPAEPNLKIPQQAQGYFLSRFTRQSIPDAVACMGVVRVATVGAYHAPLSRVSLERRK
jgi:hypothetical protein